MTGKTSKPRPFSVPIEEYHRNFDRIQWGTLGDGTERADRIVRSDMPPERQVMHIRCESDTADAEL